MLATNIFKRFILSVIASAICTVAFAQHKTIIGINLVGEFNSSSKLPASSIFVPGFGRTFERQITRHSGVETGIFYRTFEWRGDVYVDDNVFGANTIKEKYISLPVLYKFYSPILNFSVGPTFDFYVGWKQSPGNTFQIHNYIPDHNFNAGIMGKISKTIMITNNFLLEPEIRYNPVISSRRSFYGAAIAVKYQLK